MYVEEKIIQNIISSNAVALMSKLKSSNCLAYYAPSPGPS